jgi:thiosulfate/3-mercaptopyruvate sulfurtransferase
MIHRLPVAASLALVVLFAHAEPGSAAQVRRAETLVSTEWLVRHLHDANLVVLHPSSQRPDYDAGHVPGARFLAWSSFAGPRDSLSTEMPSEARFDSLLEAAGVTDASRIVIAGGPVLVASRLLVTLDYFGLGDRASLLDGGIDAWREEGRPLSRDSTVVPRGDVTLRRAVERVVDADWITAHSGPAAGVSVVDARTPEFFQGLASNNNPRAGRLPTAGSVPFTWLTGELGRYRDRHDLERLFAHAGVKRGDKVVTYCHLGMQACVAYVAARSLGYDVALYDGSFEDWSRRASLPIGTGPAGEGR